MRLGSRLRCWQSRLLRRCYAQCLPIGQRKLYEEVADGFTVTYRATCKD
jgi:hypothetical protein